MRAIQFESGAEMIEGLLRRQLFRRQKSGEDKRGDDQQVRFQLQCTSHSIDLTSRKLSAEWQRPQSGPNSPS